MAKMKPLEVEVDVILGPNLQSLVDAVKAIRDDQAANPERTHLEQLIHSKFTASIDAFQPIRDLAQSIVEEGYRRPQLADGTWILTDAEFNQELGNEWETGMRHALAWLGLKHYGEVMGKDNPYGREQ